MPLKDPTSDMAIISRKGSNLVREVHEKQSMNKSRQRFWELAGSNLGNILGVEKSADQVDTMFDLLILNNTSFIEILFIYCLMFCFQFNIRLMLIQQ